MKGFILTAVFLLSLNLGNSYNYDWGQTGHRTIGEIADNYLSIKARKQIEKILKGKSLALVSSFGDEIKSDSKYRKFGPWHYVNLPKGETKYSEENANPNGDLLMAIKKCLEVLKEQNSSRENKEFYLKMLVHFIGDLHQPLHSGRGEDRGGNDIQVRWFGEGSNLHRVWDSEMIDFYNMSYSELAQNTKDLSQKQQMQITSGSFEDWMYESKAISEKVYASTEVKENLGYRYMYDWFPVVREQLQKGGLRLASVLNEIYR
jgi:hypothetical protein